MYVEIVAPDENQGAVMTMMSRRDGVILGTEGSDGWVTLTVEAPLNKVHTYGSGLPDFSGSMDDCNNLGNLIFEGFWIEV